jgi:predicted DNA-binding protein
MQGGKECGLFGRRLYAMVRGNIIISDELDRAIDAAAPHLGRKRSVVVGKVLSFSLDYLDLEIAIERARKYETGEDKGLSAEQLRTELGL